MFHWLQYYGDLNEGLCDHWDDAFAVIRDAGITAVELTIGSEQEAEHLGGLLVKRSLALPSVYAGGRLCDEDWEETAKDMIRQAKWGKGLGATLLVSNPDPIDWNKPIDKSDTQLRRQAQALRALTSELNGMGMTLAYHTHAPEMRQSAREFHHMLLATRDTGMKFCLDFHWLYRGAGDSQVAVEDLIELYGDRIVTTHIRQSHGGVWSETLEDGDLDYSILAAQVAARGYDGPLIIECAREAGTKNAPSMLDAYRKSREWVDKTFSN
ncbi:MAG: TIM barrel protein [Fimbriimonas sp.]|nr:TIM barrel protein [Fimbriimonas sp.]